MDLILLIGIATALLIVLLTLFFLQKRTSTDHKPTAENPAATHRPHIARNNRNRVRPNIGGNVGAAPAPAPSDNAEIGAENLLDEKMGSKKRAKIEAKEQKRVLRELELKQREERRAQEAKAEDERKRQEEIEAETEKKQEEKERLMRLERERKEYEDYLKMKEAFSVEEEGYEGNEEEEKDSILYNFVQFIKSNKVVVLEDVAQEFKLRTQQVIDYIHDMQTDGRLTGVIDDRGKFIYISEDELKSVAKFIKQRGRVSIVDLAESSNNLISLVSITNI